MFLNKIFLLLTMCFLVGSSDRYSSQICSYDETIAEIDGEKITASQFQELWEMGLQLNTGNRSNSPSEKNKLIRQQITIPVEVHE